jgi:hypothetical protein
MHIIVRGGAVGCDTALQTGRYFRLHGPGVDSASNRKEYHRYLLGVPVGGWLTLYLLTWRIW